MKRQKVIAFAVAFLFVALWSLPLVRAVSLLRESRAYFAETGSIEAANDLSFSSSLLISYIVSLAAAFTVAWMYSRFASWLLVFPVLILGYSVTEILRVSPEEVIVLFPVMRPWRPATFSLIALAVAFTVFYAQRHYARTPQRLKRWSQRGRAHQVGRECIRSLAFSGRMAQLSLGVTMRADIFDPSDNSAVERFRAALRRLGATEADSSWAFGEVCPNMCSASGEICARPQCLRRCAELH